MTEAEKIPRDDWEEFDAEVLFDPPQLHANHLTKVDKKEMTKVDSPESQSEMSGDSNPDELGDIYSDAPVDINHVDEIFEMEGLEGGASDDREVNPDKEIDERTEEEKSEQSDTGDQDISESDESSNLTQSDNEKENRDSEDRNETEPDKSEAEVEDKEGAEDPIQKESEGVEEVAEATSKTSEDVHGGDEATKDIEDSPNAADDGQNSDNEGAESGEGGEDGDGDGKGGDAGSSDTESEAVKNSLAVEDWEVEADHSAMAVKLADDLKEVEAKCRDEKGHKTSLPQYDFNREASPAELEVAFRKASELLKKFAAEEEITKRQDGPVRWDAEKLVKSVVSCRYQQIPSSKYEHPKEADICILLDISGSCAEQAEMFMAIGAGSIGANVKVFVGYNGNCRASAMQLPRRSLRNYRSAKVWVQEEVDRVSGWHNQNAIGEWDFEQFLKETQPKTVIIFGDWDGINQYEKAIKNPKFRKTKFFWFANEGDFDRNIRIPKGWTNKNYFPAVYRPQDFIRVLRKIK